MTLRQKVSLCLILNALIILGEMVGGWWIGSVGLISDAAHNLIDQAGLFLTLYAVIMSATPATATRTFGHHRIGILSAFVNAVVLLIISMGIVALATYRLLHPVPVPGLLSTAPTRSEWLERYGTACSHIQRSCRSTLWSGCGGVIWLEPPTGQAVVTGHHARHDGGLTLFRRRPGTIGL